MFKGEVDCDVLVIGGGLAGLRAALAAAAAGAKTAIMLKGVLGRSGSSAIAGGGLAAVMGVSDVPEDSLEKHYADILASGDFVNNQIIGDSHGFGSGWANRAFARPH